MPNVFNRVVDHFARCCLLAVTLAACDADEPTAAASRLRVEQESGDRQTAPEGSLLERPLVARIRDRHGRPIRHAEVRWSADNGVITPMSTTTDAYGRVAAVWSLGNTAVVQRAVAVANGVDSAVFVAFMDANAIPDRLPLRALDFDTYEKSGQVVHPDVAMGPFQGVDDLPRLAVTPYPGGNAVFENPSLFIRTGRLTWGVPTAVTNPLVRPEAGYLSDPDIVWLDDRHEFWLFYRRVDKVNEIAVIRSSDGVRWTTPMLVVAAPNHDAISPTIVRRAPDDWMMWSVNAGAYGCASDRTTVELRRSTDGQTWSAPTTVSLTQPGVSPWHIEVQWIPALSEYWALFNAKVAGSCSTEALYLATSPDGVTWQTYPSPVLRRGAIPELADIVYRATFAYDATRNAVSIWHSGARFVAPAYEWRVAFERLSRADLFERANRPDAGYRQPSTAPPLTNATAP